VKTAFTKFLATLGLICYAVDAVAQTEAILPNGMTQFSDGNGAPYVGGHVYMYVPFTTTPKPTYQDPLGHTPNTNPISLDANGRAIIWGNGEYRQVVQDLNGNVVWDQLTYASPASSSGGSGGVIWYGTATGTANAITLSTPAGFVATDGQTVGFIANATNTASTTINASGFGSVLLEKNSATGPTLLVGSEIVIGNLEFATYSASLNAFILGSQLPTPGIGQQVVIASAATTDLGTLAYHNAFVSGTTTITSFGATASVQWPLYLVQFAGALTITESATMQTPNGVDITTAAGDSAWVVYLGSGAWQIIQYMPVAAQTFASPPQFRLSTSASSAVSVGSATGVGTVYAQPYGGNGVPLWNGSAFVLTPCPVMSNVLANSVAGNAGPAAAVASSVYDVVAWNNAGTCTLTRDVAWTNVTTPAAGDVLVKVSGILTNSVDVVNGPKAGFGTYLGTIETDPYKAISATVSAGGASYTTGDVATLADGVCTVEPTFTVTASGGGVVTSAALRTGGLCPVTPANPIATTSTSGSSLTLNVTWTSAPTVTFDPTPAAASGGPSNASWVGLWNEYNRVPLSAAARDSKASWTATGTSTFAASDASNKNRITVVAGQSEDSVSVTFTDFVSGGGAQNYDFEVGVNSTAVASSAGGVAQAYGGGIVGGSATGTYGGVPAVGQTYYQALEWSSGGGSIAGRFTTNVQAHQLIAQLSY